MVAFAKLLIRQLEGALPRIRISVHGRHRCSPELPRHVLSDGVALVTVDTPLPLLEVNRIRR